MPFNDGEFDVVVCRFAVHHFAAPEKVIAEMARVCRVGGPVAIEDLIASEHPERAEYYNRFERLRDTSHTRALALSELVRDGRGRPRNRALYESTAPRCGLEWFASAQTTPEREAKARAMIERDADEDLSGARPARIDGELLFTHRIAMLVTRKLPARVV